MHFRLGENFGQILLEIAQDKIQECQFEEAINVYVENIPGFTKDYVLSLLKNESVIVVSDDGETIRLTDDEQLLEENKDNIVNWEHIIKILISDIKEACKTIFTLKSKSTVNLNDYCIYRIIPNLINNESEFNGIYTLAARYISGEKLDVGKFPMFYRFIEKGDDEYNSLSKEEKNIYNLIKYISCIKYLYKDVVKLDKLYNFLYENNILNRVPKIEDVFENALHNCLLPFCDENVGYHHPLCDEKILSLKQEIYEQISDTKFGKEYIDNGIISKNMLDGYDAGFISPDGTFYGLDGSTSELLHMQLVGMLTEKLYPDYALSALDAEYTLMKHGFIKIHNNNVYGYFALNREEEQEKGYLFSPTEKQIEMIYQYANLYYHGKINTGANGDKEISVTSLKQMDELALRLALMG